MENARPQLSLGELQQVRWLLGGLLTLVSVWSVWYVEVEAFALIVLTTICAVAALVRPSLASRIPKWVHTLAFPVSLSVFAFDLYTFQQLLPSLIRLAILLLCYRVSTYRKRRDDLQLVLLGMFLVVVTGVLTVSLGFAVQIIAFTALALGLLFSRTLVEAAEGESKEAAATDLGGAWTHVDWPALGRKLYSVLDWRFWLFSLVLFSGLVGLSALLFLAIPRFQLESSLFLDRWMNKKSVSGFTDTLRFGEVSDIQKDESVAVFVDVTDPAALPAEMYWRMIVLDEYRDGAFRMSNELKRLEMSVEFTRAQVDTFGSGTDAPAAQWTFYVQPGVSRYLPLLGGFRQLRFTEPQTFRRADRLGLIVLSRDPATMKAYRVSNMGTGNVFHEPRPTRMAAARVELPAPYTELNVDAADAKRWMGAVREITGDRELDASAFAREAVRWLQARHPYALSNAVPPGEGEPLLRWTLSTQPGHCELFAGAFTLLARAAGYPARVVGGFYGATWLGDSLVIRNSNAHAWCEIALGDGRWLRVDPTAPAQTEASSPRQRTESTRGDLRQERGWSARLDRLRLLWYRRVVQFDQQEQVNLLRSLKRSTESSSRRFREWLDARSADLRAWVTQPWSSRRVVEMVMVAAGVVMLVTLWRVVARVVSLRRRMRRTGCLDPIRVEAGRWLSRFEALEGATTALPPSAREILPQLQRLRYGHSATWPPVRATLKSARRVYRSVRRGQGV